jgi:hypothetical protein
MNKMNDKNGLKGGCLAKINRGQTKHHLIRFASGYDCVTMVSWVMPPLP